MTGLVINKKQTPIEIALDIDETGHTTAKKLYKWLELDMSQYSRWVRANITDNAYAEEGKDYSTSVSSEQQGRGHFAQDYLLSASFAKKLAMSSRSPKGEETRNYFIKVEEALARTAGKNLTPAEMLLQNARILVEQERRLALIEEQQKGQEEELKEIRAGLETHPVGWYTIAGYASKIGMSLDIRTAGTLGMKATRLSREWRKKIQKTPDPRFGTVNVYCPEVLEKVFEEMEDADV